MGEQILVEKLHTQLGLVMWWQIKLMKCAILMLLNMTKPPVNSDGDRVKEYDLSIARTLNITLFLS